MVYEDSRQSGGRPPARADAGGAARGRHPGASAASSSPDPAHGASRITARSSATNELIVSTHSAETDRSGWLRREGRGDPEVAADRPVAVVSTTAANRRPANVLVVANETVTGRAAASIASAAAGRRGQSHRSSIVCPQSDPTCSEHPEAERLPPRALADAPIGAGSTPRSDRSPRPLHGGDGRRSSDERIDEIIVSHVHRGERSRWLRRDLIGPPARRNTGKPVEHIEVGQPAAVPARRRARRERRRPGRAPRGHGGAEHHGPPGRTRALGSTTQRRSGCSSSSPRRRCSSARSSPPTSAFPPRRQPRAARASWPPDRYELPVSVAGDEHGDPRHLERSRSTGPLQSISRGQPDRPPGSGWSSPDPPRARPSSSRR